MSVSKNRLHSLKMPQDGKSAENIPELLSSKAYMKIMQNFTGNPILTTSIYHSLENYEKKIKILNGEIKWLGICLHRESKKAAYYRLFNYTHDANPPLTLEETSELQNLNKKDIQLPKKQFASFIEQKITGEAVEIIEFIQQLKDELYQAQINEVGNFLKLQDIINQKSRAILKHGFTQIKESTQTDHQSVQREITKNPRIKKSLLASMIAVIDQKIIKEIEWGYKNIVKQFGCPLQPQFTPTNSKHKGKILMSLHQYPKLNIKRAFWKWHLATTHSGQQIILHTVNQLVLYTYINKTTVFYRLLGTVRKRQRKVHPRVKRMATMLFFNLRYYFNRLNKFAFDQIQERVQFKKQRVVKNLLKMGLERKGSSYRLWMKNVKDARKKQKEKKSIFLKAIQDLIKLVSQRRANRILGIISNFKNNHRINCIKKKFYSSLLASRIGMVAMAIQKMKNLPPKVDQVTLNRANQFEKGLTWFVERILRDSFSSFKQKLESGKYIKLRAVFNLVTQTSDGSKAYFYKWKSMNQQKKTIDKCSELTKLFEVCSKVTSKYLTEIVQETKFHSLFSVGLIHKYFSQLCSQTNQNALVSINLLKAHATQKKTNPWFKKSAVILCLNSRLNIQKSTWRMKFHANLPKIKLNVPTIVKLKRVFNMVRKLYVLSMYRSFLMIANYAQINLLMQKQQNPQKSIMLAKQNRQFKSEQDFEQLILKKQRQQYALVMMARIFHRNMGSHIEGWAKQALPFRKSENLQLKTKSKKYKKK